MRDLGSSNGTWLDGLRLQPGRREPLEEGAVLALGDADSVWRLVDAGPPGALARADDGRSSRSDGGVLLLPDDEAPEVAVVEGPDGWELDGEGRRVRHGDRVDAAGTSWTIDLPTTFARTLDARDGLALHFAVSPDEEFCEVTVVVNGQRIASKPRSFDYLLVTLARARLADAAHPSEIQGWLDVEDLARMLRVEPTTVNVHIHRARQAYGKLAPGLGQKLVERRPGTRQLRMGVGALTVERIGG